MNHEPLSARDLEILGKLKGGERLSWMANFGEPYWKIGDQRFSLEEVARVGDLFDVRSGMISGRGVKALEAGARARPGRPANPAREAEKKAADERREARKVRDAAALRAKVAWLESELASLPARIAAAKEEIQRLS